MADWILTLGLQNLRRQINEAFPDRDKASDGTIGDAAHAAESSSGHNADDTSGSHAEWNGDPDSTPEVRAWDMDSDLRMPGVNAQMIVDHIRALPDVDDVLRYMIYNRKIYKAAASWHPAPYSGPSPHTEHIHFSGAWSQAADNNTSFDYRLEDIAMPSAAEIAKAVWDYQLGNPYGPNGKVVDQAAGTILRYVPSRSPHEISWAKLDQLLTAAGLEAKEVPPTADENAAAVLKALGASGQSPDQIAELLAIALGKNAAAVGAALQARSAA